jgi:hypothetical protein
MRPVLHTPRILLLIPAALVFAGCTSSPTSSSTAPSTSASPPSTATAAASASPSTAPKTRAVTPPIRTSRTAPTTRTTPTVATTAPAVASNIRVYGDCTTPSVEPSEIILACADKKSLLENLHWTSWTAAGATAVGTSVYDDCTPDCARGHFHEVPGTTVALSSPVRGGDGRLVWSKLQQHPTLPGYDTGPFHGGPFPLPTRPS